MKKTQRTDAVRSVRKRIISYLSLCLIISLATGGFMITNFMEKSMKVKTDDFYGTQLFKDFEMISSAGIKPEELDIIARVEGVEDVEGVMLLDGMLQHGQDSYNVQLISLTERISIPELVDGCWPQNDAEIVIGEDFVRKCGLQIGQKVLLSAMGSYSSDPLKENEYTIVGSVRHPEYLRAGTNWVVVLPLSGFNMAATNDSYTRAFIRAEDVEGSGEVFDVYFDSVAAVHERLQQLLPTLAAGTTSRIQAQAFDAISEQWEEVEKQLADADQQLEDARALAASEIDAAEKKLAVGQQQLEDSYRSLQAGEKEYESGKKRIATAEKQINKLKPLLNDATSEYIIATLRSTLEKINDIRDASGDSTEQIEELKERLREYATEGNVRLAFFIAEMMIDYKTQELIDMTDSFEELDQAAAIIESGIEYLEDNKTVLTWLAKAMIISETDKLIDAAEKVIAASESGADGAVAAFKELASSSKGRLILALVAAKTGVDVMDLVDQMDSDAATSAAAIRDALEDLRNDSSYLDRFSIDAVCDGLQDIHDLIKEYDEAIKSGSTSRIEEIKDRIDEMLENDNNVQMVLAVMEGILDIDTDEWVEKIRNGQETDKVLKAIEDVIARIREFQDAVKNLPKWKKQLASVRQQLDDGWQQYYAGLNTLKEGQDKLETKTEEARQKLAEAEEQILAGRQEAEDKLAEYRSEVEKLTASWIITDRMSNSGFLDISSNLVSFRAEGAAMGGLFMVIAALVSFSTLIIIVEEEKKLVGTSKAFGLFNNEILGKYLVFGVSAAVIGSVLGTLLSYLGARMVVNSFEKTQMYIYGPVTTLVNWKTAIILSAIALALCTAVVVLACTDLLRSPASILMKGETNGSMKKQQKSLKINEQAKGGKLYSRLIWRNILNEKARVAIGIAVVAGSCLMMGGGITVSEAFHGMMKAQAEKINLYDVRLVLNDSTTEEEKAALEQQLTLDGIDYMSACLETHLYDDGSRITGLNILCGDPQRLGRFVGICDPKTRKQIIIPTDGILVQNRMAENYKLEKGDSLEIYDNGLLPCTATVSGQFNNYSGRMVICSPQAYREIFGTEPNDNCYYLMLNGMTLTDLQQQLDGICPGLGYEGSDDFLSRFATVAALFNILTIGMTVIAMIISFMILTNLANILMNRKHRELIVMRINGYSIRQTIGYLARETIITTITGLILGVVLGALLLPIGIRSMEPPDVQYVRDFCPKAWIIAVTLEAAFALIIYTLVFRKVRKLNFRDITG